MPKLSKLYLAILSCASFSSAATEYHSMVDLSRITLQSGDSINITSNSGKPQGVFGADIPVDIGDSGNLAIFVETNSPGARGLNLSNSDGNNLGYNTNISIKEHATSGDSAIGINVINVGLAASALMIDVESGTSAIGINSRQQSTLDLGTRSSVSVTGSNSASGINIIDSAFYADELSISSSAKRATGAMLSGNNSYANLGSKTSIVINTGDEDDASGAGIKLIGENNKINASDLIIKTNGKNANGIVIGKTDTESSVDLGNNTSIITSGENGNGIYFDEYSKASLEANGLYLETSGINGNGIEAHGGNINLDVMSFIHSQQGGGILAVTDGENNNNSATVGLYNSAVLAKTVGAQALGKGASIILESSQVTATDGFALKATNGGKISASDSWLSGTQGIQAASSGSVEFTGNTTIKSESGNALESVGNESSILGSGQAFIIGNIVAESEGVINLDLNKGSIIDGGIFTANNAQTDVTLSEKSLWISAGDASLSSLVLDNSTLIVSGKGINSVAGNTVTVFGNYNGNNGLIIFNSILGGDDSDTDKLVIHGDSSGTTQVTINNLGGRGADTVKGIEFISVNGESNGIFEKKGRIVAGAYEYEIVRGEGENYNNWYLSSSKPEPIPEPEPTPDPEPTPKPDPKPKPGVSILRPEGGAYIDNLVAANTMFNLSMADRGGETEYTDIHTGKKKVSSMWLRQSGSHSRWGDSHGQLKTQSNRYVVLLGGDLATWEGSNNDSFRLGLMAGYGNQQSKTRASINGYSSRGTTNGYSTGLYATWLQQDERQQGGYVDTWLQYNWFNHTVSGDNLSSEKYKSSGISGSVETGYDYWIKDISGSKGGGYSWFVRPKAQIIWSGISTDTHTEENGTNVKNQGRNTLQTHFGVRTTLKSSKVETRKIEPFVEANWIHNYHDYNVQMDDVSVYQNGARNIVEIKTGLDAQLSRNVNLWGNIALQIGDEGYSNTAAMLGMKYTF